MRYPVVCAANGRARPSTRPVALEGAGVIAALRLVGEPAAALADRYDLEVGGRRRHQHSPGVPELMRSPFTKLGILTNIPPGPRANNPCVAESPGLPDPVPLSRHRSGASAAPPRSPKQEPNLTAACDDVAGALARQEPRRESGLQESEQVCVDGVGVSGRLSEISLICFSAP